MNYETLIKGINDLLEQCDGFNNELNITAITNLNFDNPPEPAINTKGYKWSKFIIDTESILQNIGTSIEKSDFEIYLKTNINMDAIDNIKILLYRMKKDIEKKKNTEKIVMKNISDEKVEIKSINNYYKKLQVFISSTYTDLIEERQAVVQAVLKAGHIPAGMELFKAGKEQMETIKKWIDESDVYVLILGGRYGSIEPESGKSYTQLEYEYAIEKDMPVFAVIISDVALETKVKEHGTSVIERQEQQKYEDFKKIVNGKLRYEFDDVKDIMLHVGEQLKEYDNDDKLVGWIHGSEVAKIINENKQKTIKTKKDNRKVISRGIFLD